MKFEIFVRVQPESDLYCLCTFRKVRLHGSSDTGPENTFAVLDKEMIVYPTRGVTRTFCSGCSLEFFITRALESFFLTRLEDTIDALELDLNF